MNEVDFYQEFAEKFTKNIQAHLPPDTNVYFSTNATLDKLVHDISTQAGIEIPFNQEYIPKLKLDVVFGIVSGTKCKLILVEAKYLSKLSLKDYSQLTGYLLVAKEIEIGLLLLVTKDYSHSKLSNDFNEIVSLGKLPMNWEMEIKDEMESFAFKTGIVYYQPGNGIDWVDTKKYNGISSFTELAKLVALI